jgi:hypothetical protein
VTRPRVFWYHFSKPASRAAGRAMWSLHHAGECHVVERVVCRVPTETKSNKTQPLGVVRGKCRSVTVAAGVATIE